MNKHNYSLSFTVVDSEVVDNFLKNVNKLGGNSKQTSYPMIGTVKYCGHYNASGARKFSVSNSSLVRNGSWSLRGLREALHEAIA